MRRAVAAMADHLKPGGVLLVDPWIMEDEWDGRNQVWATFADLPELKVSRMNATIKLEGVQSILELHHLIGRPNGVEYFVERHRLGVYSKEDYLQAIAGGGLQARFEAADRDNGRPLRLLTGLKT